ncbi:hypothetical protein [Occultella kanbiaonis]|uniref:hypothetical protein n=1 Tax=Occultella kanbiaonis TaxID=2675754 RepID=UPI0012B8FAA2|nr:hypothetical protein [Occultella kanbiaonis]
MATIATPTAAAPQRYMQGIAVPASSVRPPEFFARTRRHISLERSFTYDGSETQTVVELRKSDILAGIDVRFTGSVTVAPGTGTVASTARWPYDLLRALRFTANGASNIINVSGLKLKVRDIMKRSDLTDRGVSQTFGGSAKSNGTLAIASEAWGVGANSSGLAAGTYDVELVWHVPVAEDEQDLAGAIFLATSSSDLTLTLDYAQKADLFAITGDAAVDIDGTFQVSSTKYSIPIGQDGQIVVPDLSVFHSLIQSRYANGVQAGENELRLIGQGAGKSLLRIFFQVYNGTPAAPLAMNAANFGRQAWRYANNETPDAFHDGTHMRVDSERRYNSDIGALWGFGCHDFAHENAFRDVVDMGTTSELRLVTTINSDVALTSPAVEIVQETVFLAGQAV